MSPSITRILPRDGLYLDPLFTQAAANLTRDLNFDGTIVGNVYAQPLYVDATSSPNGPMVIAVTESNNVYALNAMTGSIIWQRNVGTPITPGSLAANISPLWHYRHAVILPHTRSSLTRRRHPPPERSSTSSIP